METLDPYNPEFDGESCLVHAKQVVNQLRSEGKDGFIFYVPDQPDEFCPTGHYWVVPTPSGPEEMALNNTQVGGEKLYTQLKVNQVLRRGQHYPY